MIKKGVVKIMRKSLNKVMMIIAIILGMFAIGSHIPTHATQVIKPATKYTRIIPVNTRQNNKQSKQNKVAQPAKAIKVRTEPIMPKQRHKILQHIHKRGRFYYVSEAKNLRFQSQYDTDACEVASIKNILSIHHKAMHTSLVQICNKIGWSGNWNYHYTANPLVSGTGAAISPWLQAKILRHYGVHAHVHNYASKKTIIGDLKKGYQLIVEGGHYFNTHRISNPSKVSDHILSVFGIKYNRKGMFIQYADSEEYTRAKGVRWCHFTKFWNSYNRPHITGDRLLVAGYKK